MRWRARATGGARPGRRRAAAPARGRAPAAAFVAGAGRWPGRSRAWRSPPAGRGWCARLLRARRRALPRGGRRSARPPWRSRWRTRSAAVTRCAARCREAAPGGPRRGRARAAAGGGRAAARRARPRTRSRRCGGGVGSQRIDVIVAACAAPAAGGRRPRAAAARVSARRSRTSRASTARCARPRRRRASPACSWCCCRSAAPARRARRSPGLLAGLLGSLLTALARWAVARGARRLRWRAVADQRGCVAPHRGDQPRPLRRFRGRRARGRGRSPCCSGSRRAGAARRPRIRGLARAWRGGPCAPAPAGRPGRRASTPPAAPGGLASAT